MISSIKLHEEAAPSKPIQEVSTPPPASHRETYPALSIIQRWYYVTAAFNGLASGLIVINCFTNEHFVLGIGVGIYGFVSTLTLVATAEVIKLFTDIEKHLRAIRDKV